MSDRNRFIFHVQFVRRWWCPFWQYYKSIVLSLSFYRLYFPADYYHWISEVLLTQSIGARGFDLLDDRVHDNKVFFLELENGTMVSQIKRRKCSEELLMMSPFHSFPCFVSKRRCFPENIAIPWYWLYFNLVVFTGLWWSLLDFNLSLNTFL